MNYFRKKLILMVIIIMLFPNLIFGIQIFETDWIDVSNKTDKEIIRTLKEKVDDLEFSTYEESTNRRSKLENYQEILSMRFRKEKSRLQNLYDLAQIKKSNQDSRVNSFRKNINLIEAEIENIQNDVSVQNEIIKRSETKILDEQERALEQLKNTPFYSVVVGKTILDEEPVNCKKAINRKIVEVAIGNKLGLEVITMNIIKNNILEETTIKTLLEGKANPKLDDMMAPNPSNNREIEIFQYGIVEVYPLQPNSSLEKTESGNIKKQVFAEVVKNLSKGLASTMTPNVKNKLKKLIDEAELNNDESEQKIIKISEISQNAIVRENGIISKAKLEKENLGIEFDSKRIALSEKENQLENELLLKNNYDIEYIGKKNVFLMLIASEENISIKHTKTRLTENKSITNLYKDLVESTLNKFRTTANTEYISNKSELSNDNLSTENLSKISNVRIKEVKVLGLFNEFEKSEGDYEFHSIVAYKFGFEYENIPEKLANSYSKLKYEVLIQSTPPNAKIEIDGEFTGKTPLIFNLSNGYHYFKISKESSVAKETWFIVEENNKNVIAVDFDNQNENDNISTGSVPSETVYENIEQTTNPLKTEIIKNSSKREITYSDNSKNKISKGKGHFAKNWYWYVGGAVVGGGITYYVLSNENDPKNDYVIVNIEIPLP